MGPVGFLGEATTGDVLRFCDQVTEDVGPPFTFLEAYNIANFFCVVKARIPATGPFCYGNSCLPENATSFCDENGGKRMGQTICALPPGTRRVEGPLLWNGDLLESTAPECSGLFCAIRETVPPPTVNLRCPTALPPLGPGETRAPTPVNNPDSSVPTRGLGLAATLLGFFVSMWWYLVCL